MPNPHFIRSTRWIVWSTINQGEDERNSKTEGGDMRNNALVFPPCILKEEDLLT